MASFARTKSDGEWREEAMERMLAVEGFDVVMVCTGTLEQANYWQKRLESGKGDIIPSDCTVICVHEDWIGGGAGNGLGTLYAWQKGCAALSSRDLEEEIKAQKVSVGLYHTAGKGTRLAPLPGAENNNKPGVKLPACTKSGASLTILESVIKQTGVYASSRKGRLSVFWGDQIFVPTVDTRYDPCLAYADILCMLGPMPSAEEWKEKGLEKYGLIAVAESGAACQIEKVDYDTAVAMTSNSFGSDTKVTQVGTSLGSFSIDAELLLALMNEFATELNEKKAQFDTDPHWWMPMTLPVEAYCRLMAKKSVDESIAKAHHARIQGMISSFSLNKKHLLGPVDIGSEAYWWDYGQLKLYLKNAFRLIEDSTEAALMRTFLQVDQGQLANDTVTAASQVRLGKSSKTQDCVLANIAVEHLEAEHAIAVNCTAKRLILAPNSLAYNIIEETELVLHQGEVCTDIVMEDGSRLRQRSHIDIDGGKQWKIKLDYNPYSFEQVYKTNLSTNVLEAARQAASAHDALSSKLAFS